MKTSKRPDKSAVCTRKTAMIVFDESGGGLMLICVGDGGLYSNEKEI